MNIALFASAFYPSFGGVEELCRQLAHAHLRAGHRVIVITERWPRNLPSFQEFEGIPVYRLPFRVQMPQMRARFAFELTHRFVLCKLLQIVRANQIDLLHVQCVCSSSRYLRKVKARSGLPLVVSLQGELTMDAGGLYQRSDSARQAMRGVLSECDIITACSEQTLEEARLFMGGALSKPSCVIRNGIRLDDFKDPTPYPRARPYILAIGRHVPQKGFDVLLRAIAKLHSEAKLAYDLILAGDGPESANLRQLASELKIEPSVFFPGKVDHKTAVNLFAGCRFFVLPSRHEPFGIVNLEAMASGKAVIATAVGGVPEIVQDGVTGTLVAADDFQSLAKAIREMSDNPVMAEQLGSAGKLRAGLYDWDILASQYLSAYRTTPVPACLS